MSDVVRIAVAALVIELLVLIFFLRSLVAPLLVLASSTLVVLASLALTSLLTGPLLGVEGLTLYVPVGVGALLLAFGADYSIFVIGRIWRRAQDEPLEEAIVPGSAQASRTVTAAGIALAGSFALFACTQPAGLRITR